MSKICCFTGHRDLDKTQSAQLYNKTKRLVLDLVDEGYTDFRAGGAVGFDTLAAACVLDVKAQNPSVNLHLILPCKDQDKNFNNFDKRFYRYTIARADTVSYIRERYAPGVMQARNRALVEGADICVACLDRLTGGTYQTVKMARQRGIRVINVLKK